MHACAIATRSHDDNFVYAAGEGKIRSLRTRSAARILIECGSDQKPLFCRTVSTMIITVVRADRKTGGVDDEVVRWKRMRWLAWYHVNNCKNDHIKRRTSVLRIGDTKS